MRLGMLLIPAVDRASTRAGGRVCNYLRADVYQAEVTRRGGSLMLGGSKHTHTLSFPHRRYCGKSRRLFFDFRSRNPFFSLNFIC